MNPHLMFSSGHRDHPVEGYVASVFHNIKTGLRIRDIIGFFHTKKRGAPHQTTATDYGKLATWKCWRYCFIDFFNFMFGKKRRIVTPGLGIMRKHNDAGSFSVDTVEGNKVFERKSLFQTHEECFTKKSARGCDRQKMWFVRQQDVVILIKNGFLKRDRDFLVNFAIVENEGSFTAVTIDVQRNSMFIYYLSLFHSRDPYFRIYLWKPILEIF